MKRAAYIYLALNVWCITTGYVYAQTGADGPPHKIASVKEDTNKVNLLLTLAAEKANNEPVTAAAYARSAEALSIRLSHDCGIYKAKTAIGNSYYIRGLYDSSIILYQQARDIALRLSDSLVVGIAQVNIGSAYREKGDFQNAINYFLLGRKIIDESNDERLKAQTDDALQVLYFTRTEYAKGIYFGERALIHARNSGDRSMIARFLINLSINYISSKRITEAEYMLNESLGIAVESGDKRIEATALLNLADLAIKSKDPVKIRKYSRKSLALSRHIGSYDNEAVALKAISMSFLLEDKIDSASHYALQAFQIDSARQLRRELIETLDLMSHISFASRKPTQGFEYNRRFADSLERFVGDLISQQSAVLEKQFETEKKQKEIVQLQSQMQAQQFSIRQKTVLNLILAAGAGSILTISLLLYRTFRQKHSLQQQQISAYETEKHLFATEAVLKGEAQERARLAKDLHDGLGGLLSGIKYSFSNIRGNLVMTPANTEAFERSMDMLDSSIKEMRRVAHNMMPEALVKFGLDAALKDFCNDIDKSGALKINYQSIGLEKEAVDETMAITVYRIVQELVTNIMKHAAANTAIVQITKSNEQISLTVEDDGIGFDTSILDHQRGIGWLNVKNRAEFLKGTIDIQSEKDKGTSVHIEFKS